MPLPRGGGSGSDPPDCGADRDHGKDDRPALPGSRRPADAHDFGLKPLSRVVHDASGTGKARQPRLSLPGTEQYMSRTEEASMPADIVTVDDGPGAESTIPTNATSGSSRHKSSAINARMANSH